MNAVLRICLLSIACSAIACNRKALEGEAEQVVGSYSFVYWQTDCDAFTNPLECDSLNAACVECSLRIKRNGKIISECDGAEVLVDKILSSSFTGEFSDGTSLVQLWLSDGTQLAVLVNEQEIVSAKLPDPHNPQYFALPGSSRTIWSTYRRD